MDRTAAQCSGAEINVPVGWGEHSGESLGKPSQRWLSRTVCCDVLCSGGFCQGLGRWGTV